MPSFPSFRFHRGALALAIAGLFVAGGALAQPGHGDGHDRGHGPAPFARVFDAVDADGDGVITRAEADAFHAARTAGLDADGDGFVSFEELRAHRQRKREERARARFEQLDADGDGRVSLQEFDARHAGMFERLDADGDGAISREELPHARRWGKAPPRPGSR